MTSSDEFICSECGEPQIPFAEGLSMGMRCPKCGTWGVITTNPDALLATKKPLPCPICQQEMKLSIKDNVWHFTCEHCQYAGFSLQMPEIYRDSTQYQVTLNGLSADNKQHLSVLAKAFGVNATEAHQIIATQTSVEHFCDAITAVKIRSILLENSIQHHFSPELKCTTLDLIPLKEPIS